LRQTGKLLALLWFAAFIFLDPTTPTAHATPSTELWTPAIMDVQPFGVWHLGIDNYFTVGRNPATSGAFPTDVGMTVGVLPFTKLNAEVGIDLLEPIEFVCGGAQKSPGVFLTGNGAGPTACPSVWDGLSFNAKIGIPEGTFFGQQPGVNIGIFNVGTVKNVTDMDILDLIVGKTIPVLGRIHGGAYIGNAGSALMHEAGIRSGSTQNAGGIVAFDRGFWTVKEKDGTEYSKVSLLADYATGKNYIGGAAVGAGFNFTPNIDVLTGPVWFNDHVINGAWKWTTQLDINF